VATMALMIASKRPKKYTGGYHNLFGLFFQKR